MLFSALEEPMKCIVAEITGPILRVSVRVCGFRKASYFAINALHPTESKQYHYRLTVKGGVRVLRFKGQILGKYVSRYHTQRLFGLLSRLKRFKFYNDLQKDFNIFMYFENEVYH